MKIQFQADADLNEDIIAGVLRREPRIDFQMAAEADFRSLSDRRVLALAAGTGRILVSHDRKTMPRHFAEFIQANTSPGLLIVSQKADLLSVIDGLLLIWSASEPVEWVNVMCAIPL